MLKRRVGVTSKPKNAFTSFSCQNCGAAIDIGKADACQFCVSTVSCRALENGVYFLAANRIGTERGFVFIGKSQICDPSGNCLHLASDSDEEIFYADIDPAAARRKHIIRVPGQHEIHRTADRRPEMYSGLCQPHGLQGLRS